MVTGGMIRKDGTNLKDSKIESHKAQKPNKITIKNFQVNLKPKTGKPKVSINHKGFRFGKQSPGKMNMLYRKLLSS